MTELLRAVCDHPDDLAARRVWGDVLLERGDSAGELVHVQCALADGVGTAALRRREHELLAAMPEIPGITRTYRNGMIEGLAGPAARVIAVANELAATTPIRTLELAGATVADVRAVLEAPWSDRLGELGLVDDSFDADIARLLAARGLPLLRALDLQRNDIDPDAFRVLRPVLARLESLYLGCDHHSLRRYKLLDEPSLVELLADSTSKLRRLELAAVLYLKGNNAELLRGMALPELEELDLNHSSNGLNLTSVAALVESPVARHLRALGLASSGETRYGLYFPTLAKLPALEELDCAHEQQTHGMEKFAAHAWPRLRRLNLHGSSFAGGDIEALVGAELPAMVDLDVALQSFSSCAALLHYARAPWPLQRLVMANTPFDAPAVAALGRARFTTTLQELSLASCKLDAAAIAALCDATWPALERLDLSDNPIGADGAMRLATAQLPALYALRIDTADLPQAAVGALRERYGDVR